MRNAASWLTTAAAPVPHSAASSPSSGGPSWTRRLATRILPARAGYSPIAPCRNQTARSTEDSAQGLARSSRITPASSTLPAVRTPLVTARRVGRAPMHPGTHRERRRRGTACDAAPMHGLSLTLGSYGSMPCAGWSGCAPRARTAVLAGRQWSGELFGAHNVAVTRVQRQRLKPPLGWMIALADTDLPH